jgi:hypothetical protein
LDKVSESFRIRCISTRDKYLIKISWEEYQIYHKDEIDQDVVVDNVLNRILSALIYDQFEFLYHWYWHFQVELLNLLILISHAFRKVNRIDFTIVSH